MLELIISTVFRWATIGYAIDCTWEVLKDMNKSSPMREFFNRKKKRESPTILLADD